MKSSWLYILDEQNNLVPIGNDILTFSPWFENARRSRRLCVQETILPDRTRISTVFLGMNHNPLGDVPLVFETMVFAANSWTDLEMMRYSAWHEAHAGHDQMAAKWFERLDPLQKLIDEMENVDDFTT